MAIVSRGKRKTQDSDVSPPKETTVLMLKTLLGDFIQFANKMLKVQTPESHIVPFNLNGPQKLLHKIVENIEKDGRLVRIVALKARRMGFSTYFSARFYRKTAYAPNKYAIQITHEPEATDTLFKMVKRFYNLSTAELRPETLYNNMRLLEFNNKEGTGLNSGFRVATAGKEDFGSGQLVHFCHFSESSKWNVANASDLLTSVLQCVPDNKDTEVVFESTAKGVGGEFYDRFWRARHRCWVKCLDENGEPVIEESVNDQADIDNIYTSVFLPYFVYNRYRMKVPNGFALIRDDENTDLCEVRLKEQFGLSDDQIVWRRFTLVNKCDNDINIFRQEYPATPMEAFVGTGRPVFDNVKLMKIRDALPDPITRYDPIPSLRQWVANATDGRLFVWEEPKPGQHYVIGADVAEGLKQGDYSCADVVNHRTGVQVAQFHGKCFAPKTLIVTSTGMKNIEDIDVGDMVWTHKNRFRPVVRKMARDYHGDMVRIRSQGNYETIVVTPDHPFLSVGMSKEEHKQTMFYGVRLREDGTTIQRKERVILKRLCIGPELNWVSAATVSCVAIPKCRDKYDGPFSITIDRAVPNIKKRVEDTVAGYCLCGCGNRTTRAQKNRPASGIIKGQHNNYILGHSVPSTIEHTIPLNEDFAVVLGYYGSEGSIGRRRGDGKLDKVDFSFGHHERDTIAQDCHDRLVRLGFVASLRVRGSSCMVSVYDSYLPQLLQDLCGSGAKGKMLSPWCMSWPIELLTRFFEGYWLGDGCSWIQDSTQGKSITTVSPLMARQLRDIAVWLGYRPRLERVIARTMGPTVKNVLPRYNIKWTTSDLIKYRGLSNDRILAYPIKSKTIEEYSGLVYNLEVADDNSYSTACYVVHNCDPDQFGVILCMLGKRYNTALVAPERNNHGLTTVTVMHNQDYQNIYSEMVPDPPGKPRRRYGWLTGRSTRPLMIDTLVKELREDQHGIQSKDTVDEMLRFKRDDHGRMQADEGAFDDRVISYCIAKHVRDTIDLPLPPKPKHYKDGRAFGQNNRVSSLAWT